MRSHIESLPPVARAWGVSQSESWVTRMGCKELCVMNSFFHKNIVCILCNKGIILTNFYPSYKGVCVHTLSHVEKCTLFSKNVKGHWRSGAEQSLGVTRVEFQSHLHPYYTHCVMWKLPFTFGPRWRRWWRRRRGQMRQCPRTRHSEQHRTCRASTYGYWFFVLVLFMRNRTSRANCLWLKTWQVQGG